MLGKRSEKFTHNTLNEQLQWIRTIYMYTPELCDIFSPFSYLFIMLNRLPLIIVTKAYSAGNSMGVFHTTKKIDEWTMKLVMFFIKIMCSLGAHTSTQHKVTAIPEWRKLFFDFFPTSCFRACTESTLLKSQSCVFSWWQFNPTFLQTNTHTHTHERTTTQRRRKIFTRSK